MTLQKKPELQGTPGQGPRLLAGSRPERHAPAAQDGQDEDPARPAMLRAQQGDLDAFRALIEMFQDRVFRIVISVLHCDRATAEDLSQEVFLRVHKGLPTFDGQARFGTWLHTIAMNVAISEYRKRRAMKRDRRTLSLDAPQAGTDDLFIDPEGRETDPGERADQRDFVAKVRAALQRLPEEFQGAVMLRDMEGMSYEEVAAVLGVPPGTVRSRIHRGRLMLQEMLQEFRP
jgi:RNA polymerase sigma-70 factor (ECF subfamily)